ncbi:mutS protein homolog 4-like [Topomyia yanbarensis]|uniref:mutS protein homolog 4-like n=1 Tax=Topomyia yanbarensis TaxID=2498891 RepID=UPI00273B2531|nr:mutS protein homolog 4-like [Topomyia yanbarensis]
MNFIKNRIDRKPEPLAKPQIFRHIDFRRPGYGRGNARSIHDTLNETLAANEPYVICAIAEGRGHATLEIGLCAIDLSAPVLQMTQFSDNFWYSNVLTSLQTLDPVVIFFSDHSLNSRTSTLPTIIRQILPDVQIIGLSRSFFNDVNAQKYMDELCCSSYQTMKSCILAKYYGLAAVGAVLRHCFESNLLRIAPKSLQFRYLSKQSTLAVDVECVSHLELIYSLKSMADKSSLYRLVNHCITGIGKRHLRANLLEPSCCRETVEKRLNCVRELLTKADILCGIQGILRNLVDIGGLMKLSVDVDNLKTTKQNMIHVLNQASTLRNALQCIPTLEALLQPVESSILVDVKKVLQNQTYKRLLTKICTVLDSGDCSLQTPDYHRLFLVKSGVSSTLDVLRGLYTEVIDDIREYVAELTREHRLLLKMSFTKALGFHIQVSVKETDTSIPSIFKILGRSGQRFSLTTAQLQALNERVNGTIREIETVSYATIKQLIDCIREDVNSVYTLVAHITDLDVLQSLAVVSQDRDYCRPSFGRTTKIVAARHPLLESYGENEKIVKNNIIATPEYNVFIVTGPNMSGKTVYLKTICLLQIMVQLGCYVPASKAEFRIADRLMAIFGAAENIEQDLSNSSRMSRKLEMIAHSLTVNSLVIIDELFGDTHCPDMESPRWKLLERLVKFIDFQEGAACESLSAIGRPFVYLTTHCHDMLRPLEQFNNVSRLYLQTETFHVDGVDRLRYKYTVAEGKTNVKNYGISLARCVRIPDSVIKRAEQINEQLRNSNFCEPVAHDTTTFNGSISTETNHRQFGKQLYNLYAQIASLISEADERNGDRLGEQLNSLLAEFTSSLPREVVDYLKDTSLESLLQQRKQMTQSSLGRTRTSEFMIDVSNNRATLGSERFDMDDTICIDEDSEEF